MSPETEGRPASAVPPSPSLAPSSLPVLVQVRPECIELGYNASGRTVLSVDVAALAVEERTTLRALLGKPNEPGKPWPGAHPLAHRGNLARLAVPTLEALAAYLRAAAEVERLVREESERESEVDALVAAAVERILAPLPPEAGMFTERTQFLGFAPAYVELIRTALDASVGPALRALREARGRSFVAEGTLEGQPREASARHWPEDWIGRSLAEAFHFLRGAWAEPHRKAYDTAARRMEAEQAEAQRRASPEGMVAAVIAELGTGSQAERWGEGMLPDEETDAILARHVFAPVLRVCPPERRLEREDVVKAVRAHGVTSPVTKVAFLSQEASGLDDGEWRAFKAFRALVPEDVAANVVRTIASAQTAEGGFTVRRTLVSLKGRFAGRDVRMRVHLLAELSVAPA